MATKVKETFACPLHSTGMVNGVHRGFSRRVMAGALVGRGRA